MIVKKHTFVCQFLLQVKLLLESFEKMGAVNLKESEIVYQRAIAKYLRARPTRKLLSAKNISLGFLINK